MYARGCIVGLTRGVNRAHIARSVLEAIAYQMTDLLEAMEDDSGITFTELRVDGGASVSDILLQIQSDMIRTIVDRPKTVETTALGAAYLAGLAVGYWKDRDEIAQNREIEKIFTPKMEKSHRDELYKAGSVQSSVRATGRRTDIIWPPTGFLIGGRKNNRVFSNTKGKRKWII